MNSELEKKVAALRPLKDLVFGDEKQWFWVWPYKNYKPFETRPVMAYLKNGAIYFDLDEVGKRPGGVPYENAFDCLSIAIDKPAVLS